MDSSPVGSAPPVRMPVAKTLPVRLLRAREAVMARLRPILRAHNLTEQQWRVLRTLYDLQELEVTTLAGKVYLLPPSLSRILRDLEARGLVLRRGSVDDQRRALVSLSDSGKAVIAEVGPILTEVWATVRTLYGPERVAALEQLLSELETVLAQAEGLDGEG
jgi:homoprotocatechuate degradation regulator HpaR